MNRVTIINGLEGEGKTQELIMDFLGHVKDDKIMKHYFLTSLDHKTAVDLIEHMIEGMRKNNPDFAKNANMGVYTVSGFDDLERIAKDVDDDSTVLYVDGTEFISNFDMERFLELVDEHQFDCYITRQRCKETRGLPPVYFKNCLITIGMSDLLPENGREVMASRTDSIHYDLFTGEKCKITDLESSVIMDRTITTVKVGGKYVIDVYDVDASVYRDGKVIGKSSFVYMPVEKRTEHLVMEQFCGEQGDCSLLNYWLTEYNIADVASMLSKAK